MKRRVRRMAQLGDKILFRGRVIVRAVRGYLVGANTKYLPDVIAVLGVEDSSPVATPNVKRTTTFESLVYKTAVGKLLCVCQERADFI